MATVTYRAPDGDDEMVIMAGVKFFDGHAVEVSEPAKVALFKGNRFFDVADVEAEAVEMTAEADAPKRRGRPPKMAAIEAETEEGGE